MNQYRILDALVMVSISTYAFVLLAYESLQWGGRCEGVGHLTMLSFPSEVEELLLLSMYVLEHFLDDDYITREGVGQYRSGSEWEKTAISFCFPKYLLLTYGFFCSFWS
jgi:hypothetical protein